MIVGVAVVDLIQLRRAGLAACMEVATRRRHPTSCSHVYHPSLSLCVGLHIQAESGPCLWEFVAPCRLICAQNKWSQITHFLVEAKPPLRLPAADSTWKSNTDTHISKAQLGSPKGEFNLVPFKVHIKSIQLKANLVELFVVSHK